MSRIRRNKTKRKRCKTAPADVGGVLGPDEHGANGARSEEGDGRGGTRGLGDAMPARRGGVSDMARFQRRRLRWSTRHLCTARAGISVRLDLSCSRICHKVVGGVMVPLLHFEVDIF